MILGLDFGTSTTVLSTAAGTFSIGTDALIPSTALYEEQGNRWLFGTEVFGASVQGAVISDLKSAITHNESTLRSRDGKSVFNADDVITKFLEHIAERLQYEEQFETLDVRMSCPAFWDKAQRIRLLACAKSAGFNVLGNVLLDEPVSAAVGWLESAATNKVKLFGERILVFDMGGGTLDLAILDLGEKSTSKPGAFYQVIAAHGSTIAGNAVDIKIAANMYKTVSRSQLQQVDANGGESYFLQYAKDIKESLSDSDSFSLNIPMPSGSSLVYELRLDQLRDILYEVFASGAEAVHDSIKKTLRLAAAAELGPDGTLSDLSRLPISELAMSIDGVLLVGGMARMPLLEEYLIDFFEQLLSSEPPTFWPNDKSSVQEVVSLGLGLPRNFSNVNLMRPDFDIVLRIYDARSDIELGYYIIWDAYSKHFETKFDPNKPSGFLGITKSFSAPVPSDYSRGEVSGEIRVISNDSTPLLIEARNQKGGPERGDSDFGKSGFRFRFREEGSAFIHMHPSGFFRITDEGGTVTKGQLQVWPEPLIIVTNENYLADGGNKPGSEVG